MLKGEARRHASAGRAVQKTDLHQVRLDDLFDRVFFFVQSGSDGPQTDWSAVEFFDYRQQEFAVHLVETVRVDLHSIERVVGDRLVDRAIVVDLGKIANAAQQAVGYTRSSPRSSGDLVGTIIIDLDL